MISPNDDNTLSQKSSDSRLISIDKFKLSHKSPVLNEIKAPLNQNYAIGNGRAATVGGVGTLVANGTDASFVGMRSSYASARRSPLVHTAYPTVEHSIPRPTSKLRVMPRKAPPVTLNPVPEVEKFEFARGVRIAFGVELVAGLSLYGMWHLWHLIR